MYALMYDSIQNYEQGLGPTGSDLLYNHEAYQQFPTYIGDLPKRYITYTMGSCATGLRLHCSTQFTSTPHISVRYSDRTVTCSTHM